VSSDNFHQMSYRVRVQLKRDYFYCRFADNKYIVMNNSCFILKRVLSLRLDMVIVVECILCHF